MAETFLMQCKTQNNQSTLKIFFDDITLTLSSVIKEMIQNIMAP